MARLTRRGANWRQSALCNACAIPATIHENQNPPPAAPCWFPDPGTKRHARFRGQYRTQYSSYNSSIQRTTDTVTESPPQWPPRPDIAAQSRPHNSGDPGSSATVDPGVAHRKRRRMSHEPNGPPAFIKISIICYIH